MTKEEFEELIKNQPEEIKTKAALLLNATVICRDNYKKTPTSANRREWEDAQAAFKKYAAQISLADAEPVDKPLATLADVLNYLLDSEWKVTKTTLYRQHKEGKISPRPDGAYALKDVEKYARTWLKQKSTGKRIAEKLEELQRRKLEMELSNLELENKRKALAYGKDVSSLIPREQVENELATRAGILLAGFKHWIQSRAAEWIRLTDGDTRKVGDLINLMNHDLDEHINSYAAPLDYDVIIDAEDAETTEAQEIREKESEYVCPSGH
jgi:hypothetical protein